MKAFYDRFIRPQNVVPDTRLFSPEHIVLSTLALLFIFLFFRLQMKHCDEDYSKKILKRIAVVMLLLELFRIGWRTFYYGFSLKNIRFDWCNQICMIMPFIVLSGNKKLFPYIDILAFMGGMGVVIYPLWVFYDYAGIHIMSLQSMVSHTLMVITTVSMPFVSSHWENEKGIKKPLIGFLIIAAIAAVMSKMLDTNYLLMMNSNGIPVLERFSFPWYWLIGLPCLALLINLVRLLFRRIDHKIDDKKAALKCGEGLAEKITA